MIQHLTLNKSREKKLILVHGLFTGEGFWLEYLHHFRDFKIIFLKVNYMTLQIDQISKDIERIIEKECNGQADLMITHSLGSVLSACLMDPSVEFIFNVAPVVNGHRLEADKFKSDIGTVLDDKLTREEIDFQLKNADELIEKVRAKAENKKQTQCPIDFIPDEDEYFVYDKTEASQAFNGNHFQIEEAIANIMELVK